MGDDLLWAVEQVLADAGFDVGPTVGDGLRLRADERGVLIGWCADTMLQPTLTVHADDADLRRRTEIAGIRNALNIALTAILRAAGFHVAPRPDELLLITREPSGASRKT